MEKNNTLVVAIAVLILGLVLGYMFGQNNSDARYTSGMHRMPDGTMMGDGVSGGMSGMMTSMMSGLNGKTGDAFDKAFLEEMIVHHEGAVVMAEAALKYAKHEEIKNLSRAIISAQNREIAEMQEWYKAWYNN